MIENYFILGLGLFSLLILFAIADFIVWVYLKVTTSKRITSLYLGVLKDLS